MFAYISLSIYTWTTSSFRQCFLIRNFGTKICIICCCCCYISASKLNKYDYTFTNMTNEVAWQNAHLLSDFLPHDSWRNSQKPIVKANGTQLWDELGKLWFFWDVQSISHLLHGIIVVDDFSSSSSTLWMYRFVWHRITISKELHLTNYEIMQ